MVLVHPLRDVRTSEYLFVLAFLNTCKMATPIPGIHIRKKRWLVPLVMILISRKLKFFQQMSIRSVQFSHSVMSDSLRPHELQHARPPCPSPTLRVHPNPCPSSRWCHLNVPSSVIPFSSCPQSFPASGSFQMSQFFASGGQSIGVSASISVLPMNTQDWLPIWRDLYLCHLLN